MPSTCGNGTNEYRDERQVPPEGYDHRKVVEGMDREIRWFADQPEAARRLFAKYLNLAQEGRRWR